MMSRSLADLEKMTSIEFFFIICSSEKTWPIFMTHFLINSLSGNGIFTFVVSKQIYWCFFFLYYISKKNISNLKRHIKSSYRSWKKKFLEYRYLYQISDKNLILFFSWTVYKSSEYGIYLFLLNLTYPSAQSSKINVWF